MRVATFQHARMKRIYLSENRTHQVITAYLVMSGFRCDQIVLCMV